MTTNAPMSPILWPGQHMPRPQIVIENPILNRPNQVPTRHFASMMKGSPMRGSTVDVEVNRPTHADLEGNDEGWQAAGVDESTDDHRGCGSGEGRRLQHISGHAILELIKSPQPLQLA